MLEKALKAGFEMDIRYSPKARIRLAHYVAKLLHESFEGGPIPQANRREFESECDLSAAIEEFAGQVLSEHYKNQGKQTCN